MSFALFILGVFWSFDLYFPLSGPGSLYGTFMVTSHFPSLRHHQRTAIHWPVHGTDPVFRTLSPQHCRVLTQNKTFPHFFLFFIYWSHVCTCRSVCHRSHMEVKEQLEGHSLFSMYVPETELRPGTWQQISLSTQPSYQPQMSFIQFWPVRAMILLNSKE